MSFFVTRPETPEPWIEEMSTLFSAAILRTSGEDFVRLRSSSDATFSVCFGGSGAGCGFGAAGGGAGAGAAALGGSGAGGGAAAFGPLVGGLEAAPPSPAIRATTEFT